MKLTPRCLFFVGVTMLEWLFDTGPWSEILRVVFTVANVIVAVGHFVSGVCVALLWMFRRHEVRNHFILLVFVVFFILGGISRGLRTFAFQEGLYRFITVLDVFSGLSSIAVLITLPFVTILALKVPSVKTFEKTVKEKQELEAEKCVLETAVVSKEKATQALTRKVETLQAVTDKLTESTPVKEIIAKLEERLGNDDDDRRRHGQAR